MAPPYTHFPINVTPGVPHPQPHPQGHTNPQYFDSQEDHIYAEIYDEIAKFPRSSASSSMTVVQPSFTNSGYTNGARTNAHQNYLKGIPPEHIHVNFINGSSSESHDFNQPY